MLRKNPNERPSINEVFTLLRKTTLGADDVSEVSTSPCISTPESEMKEKVGLRSTFKKEPPKPIEEKVTKPTLRSKTWDVS